MRITAKWYNGESWRVFPNVEITQNSDIGAFYYDIVWLKFIIEIEFVYNLRKYCN